jgi:hypothetical protein
MDWSSIQRAIEDKATKVVRHDDFDRVHWYRPTLTMTHGKLLVVSSKTKLRGQVMVTHTAKRHPPTGAGAFMMASSLVLSGETKMLVQDENCWRFFVMKKAI